AALGCAGQSALPVDAGGGAAVDSAEPDVAAETAAPPDVAVEPDTTPPDTSFDATAPARLVIDPTEQRFGFSVAGCPPPPISFRVSNAGESASGQLAVMTGAEFPAIADSCDGQSLPPGGSCTIAIQFRGSFGERSSTLVVSAHPGGRVEARMTALVFPDDSVSVFPSRVDFGSIEIGDTSPPRSFELKNIGGMTITVGKATTSTEDFVMVKDDCRDRNLGPGETCQLAVSHRPQRIGGHSALLTVSNVGCGHGGAQATLAGFGLSPHADLVITPTAAQLGDACSASPTT